MRPARRCGRITKQGPGVVRKVLVQGAHHVVRRNKNSARKHERLAKKRGRGVARVAAAGDLLDTADQLLKTRTPYRDAHTTSITREIKELERMAARTEARAEGIPA